MRSKSMRPAGRIITASIKVTHTRRFPIRTRMPPMRIPRMTMTVIANAAQGFFLAHLSAIPAAVAIPVFPDRRVDHFDLLRIALEFSEAPPVPPPQLYLL